MSTLHDLCDPGCTKTHPGDPAYWMLLDDYVTVPEVYREGCYICEDPEFAQMGLPLCKPCPQCSADYEGGRNDGHVPADDAVCTDCGFDITSEF